MILGGKLSLWDIDDVEAFTHRTIHEHVKRRRVGGLHPGSEEWEDLFAYLVGVTYELSLTYRPELAGAKPSFAGYALAITKLRITDWYRQRNGGRRGGPRLEFFSLDEFAAVDGGRRLDSLVASRADDPTADCAPDLDRVLEAGGRADDRLGVPRRRGAARRAA